MFSHRGQNFVEPIVVFLERFSQHRKPLVHCVNAGLVQTTRALRALDATDNESRVLEYFEVLRDCRLGHREGLRQFHDGRLSLGEACKNRATRRIGQGRESSIEVRHK
jgi:hypothetical protein